MMGLRWTKKGDSMELGNCLAVVIWPPLPPWGALEELLVRRGDDEFSVRPVEA